MPLVTRTQFILLAALACTATLTQGCESSSRNLAGDWDVYIALSAQPKFGFEGWRRMAFAHFAGRDSGNVGFLKRRTGQPLLTVHHVATYGDSVVLAQDSAHVLRAAWHGDSLAGLEYVRGHVADHRFRLVRRGTPGVVEHEYQVWKMPASDSQYAVTEDTLVFMPTRDGARLATYIARPVGPGPFGVVLQRTPYRRILRGAGRWWASRGYIFVAQHVRGREESSGDARDFGDYDHDIPDGYDAVEWAARLPGANGKVGMIGHSDEGRLAWYAAVSNPPHLAAISPTAATADPWMIVPYAAMAFGPVNVDWACLMRNRTMDSQTADLDIGEAITRLPLSTLPQRLGCGDVPMWDRWIAHPTLDDYWRRHAATTYIVNVRAPVLSMAGWHDDSRGPTYYTDALLKVPDHPNWHIVMGVGAHKGVDYVAGDFGPDARYAYRDLQLRWFDHYLLGRDNGVDTLPHLDIFVQGDNTWRTENSWPLDRQVLTNWYITSGGHAQTSSGDGLLDSVPPTGAPSDTFTYDPGNPTPYLIDSRELEESLNEDYTQLNATRRDALVFTSRPLTRPLEVTGEMSAVLWASSDARDTDWSIMLLDVWPDGHAERVQDGLVRARFRAGMDHAVPLVPGQVNRYDIDLWFTSRVFEPGHRIRVSIASALFPKYDRNLNTGGSNERDSTFVLAHQAVLHDASHPSHVVLPVIPR
ncbi:MAG TPA: CocE/NonD family hydrolase [Gemmatimonadales bacterium]|jgi:putative CocE/NonD family hydrolase|nr:CocE/NonD family hydrolase [Gemmatimonadales bacterium]